MAYERGLLKAPNLNELQERLLMFILLQEKVDAFRSREDEFERELMIHRPEIWQKIQEEREEAREMGFDQIVWKSPESLEEYEEIERILREAEGYPEVSEEELIPTNPLLYTLNVDELGDDE